MDLFNSTVSLATSIFSGVFNLFLGVIFAMYVLMQKETLARQITNVLRAHLPTPRPTGCWKSAGCLTAPSPGSSPGSAWRR